MESVHALGQAIELGPERQILAQARPEMSRLVYLQGVVTKKVVYGGFTDEMGVEGYRDGFQQADEFAPLLDRQVRERGVFMLQKFNQVVLCGPFGDVRVKRVVAIEPLLPALPQVFMEAYVETC